MIRCDGDGLLLGVCSRLAKSTNIDVGVMRVAWALSMIFAGVPLLVYLICWLILKVTK